MTITAYWPHYEFETDTKWVQARVDTPHGELLMSMKCDYDRMPEGLIREVLLIEAWRRVAEVSP